MMRLKSAAIFLLAVILTAGNGCFLKDWNRVPTPVVWADVQAEIAKHVCVAEYETSDGGIRYVDCVGDWEGCKNEGEPTRLSRAIDNVFEQARLLFVGIELEKLGYAFDSTESLDISTRKLQEVCLSANIFLDPILRRLSSELAGQGLFCDDCPPPSQRPFRSVTWDEFSPYVSAHAWPDPVTPALDDEGNPTGKRNYTFHVCSGINGISEMDEPDEELTRTAYVIAIGSKTFMKLALSSFSAARDEEMFEQLTDNDARTSYLRRRMSQILQQKKELLKEVCRVLRKYEDDFRIRLDRCQPGSSG